MRKKALHTLPGGSGIGSAGTMTGPRGASLDWDSAWRVTLAGRKSQETRPWAEPWHWFAWREPRWSAERRARSDERASAPEALSDGDIRRCGAEDGWCAFRRSASLAV